MTFKIRDLWLIPVLSCSVGVALADDVRMYRSGEVPEASEIANILRGGTTMHEPPAQHRPKMRGISLDPVAKVHEDLDPGTKAVTEPSSEAVVKTSSTVVGLPIEFAFNSSRILPKNEAQLDAVAEGIKMAGDITVIVEGHTDASGSEAYNYRLSRQRAEAVKQYLIERHGIASSRLIVQGLGESDPLDPSDPFGAENRRVQLRAAK